MKVSLFTVILFCLALSVMTARAEEVKVYCKDGKIIQAQVISLSFTAVKIDPAGPVSMRTLAASEVDSIVSLSGNQRAVFPLDPNQPLPEFGRYKSTVRRLLTRRFGLGVYGGYRLAHTFAHITFTDNQGTYNLSQKIGGSSGFGLTMAVYWPIANDRAYFEGFTDIGGFGETLSINDRAGSSLVFADFNYLEWNFGIKPMIPLNRGRAKLFLSPTLGFSLLATNLRSGSSPYYGYSPYGAQPNFDARFLALYGASLDLMSERHIGASFAVIFSYGDYYLENVSAFSTTSFRLTFNYLSDL